MGLANNADGIEILELDVTIEHASWEEPPNHAGLSYARGSLRQNRRW